MLAFHELYWDLPVILSKIFCQVHCLWFLSRWRLEEILDIQVVAAIRKWAGLVLIFRFAFDVGRKLLESHGMSHVSIHEML